MSTSSSYSCLQQMSEAYCMQWVCAVVHSLISCVAFLGFWTARTVLKPISGQIFDEGHGESGVLHSARWHDGDWMLDGIREAWLRCFVWMEIPEGSELANKIANDAKMVAKVAKLTANLIAKNDANLDLPPRFRKVLIQSPL
ncbi:uncharacterized protein TNCV_96821 [Trichonephila clavipes]|nr:uncharacterized protein TNCV_96821 [Trichonephila clavipes]